MERKKEDVYQFRSMLFSIAYNMLGTIADAEDMVQETYASWLKADKSHVENIRFYLIRTISNKCITHLKKLKQQREAYTGTWLPEPWLSDSDTENDHNMQNNLSIGFMYLLEKLTPIERGVIILKEAFELKYSEICKIFDISNESCRQHFSRAKKKLLLEKTRFKVDTSEHEEILRKFLDACLSRNLEALIDLLREDVVVYGDGGGNASAVLKPVSGKEKVLRLLLGGMKKAEPITNIEILSINGLSGAVLYQGSGKNIPDALIAIDIDEDKKITNLYFISNPEKLQHIKNLD